MLSRSWLPLALPTLFGSLLLVAPDFSSSQTAVRIVDRDRDFLPDHLERRRFGTSPRRRDTDRDGIADGDEDRNNDGRLNKDVYERGDRDRDRDGLADENERQWGCDPRDPDTDDDGILDGNDSDNLSAVAFEDRDDRPGEGPRAEDRDDNGTPVPTVRPTSTPTRRPTSTPRPPRTPTPTIPPASCFDGNGNTLDGCFGIPLGLSGNIGRGQSRWLGTCVACHLSEQRSASYSRINNALIAVPDMRNLSLSAPEIADLAAYLNRP